MRVFAIILPLFLYSVAAGPLDSRDDKAFLNRRSFDKENFLRILPLGASITVGDKTRNDNPILNGLNGYRKYLRDRLVPGHGYKVNMVGTKSSATMLDNNHEGVGGERVSQVNTRAIGSVKDYRPNIILINAGTNDATQDLGNEPASTTHTRMETMINQLSEIVPNTVIILSTLIPNTRIINGVEAQRKVDVINENYRRLVGDYNRRFPLRKLILADMDDGFILRSDIYDGTHPTEEGYREMAAVWEYHILDADARDLVSKAPDSSNDDGSGYNWNTGFICEKKYASGNDNDRAGREVLAGANSLIISDGPYIHKSQTHDPIYTTPWSFDSPDVRFVFAQLIQNNPSADKSEALDEMVMATTNVGTKLAKLVYSKNLGGGLFETSKSSPYQWRHDLSVKYDCPLAGVNFGDVDGDGLDDFVCIGSQGEIMYHAIWEESHLGSNIEELLDKAHRATRESMFAGDIDSDGRLDYCLIGNDGNIRCWRNGDHGQDVAFWQAMGTVFQAQGLGDIRGVRFVDINGDGRADWIWLDKTGKTADPRNGDRTLFMNQRNEGNGLAPAWLRAISSHNGGFNITDGGSRDQIQFGRVFGSGRADYIHIKSDCPTEARCYYNVWPYENLGSGGKFQKGDGIYWGDMRNRGVDD